jgi:hypothetical protein
MKIRARMLMMLAVMAAAGAVAAGFTWKGTVVADPVGAASTYHKVPANFN